MPRTPKPAAQRQRRNRVTSATTLEAPHATKIDLPTRYSPWLCRRCRLERAQHTAAKFAEEKVRAHAWIAKEIDWHPLTRSWWDVIWASPMVAEWVDADVPELVAIAAMVDEFWRLGDTKVHSEIRMSMQQFGLTPMSRRSLQWEIKRLEELKPPARASAPRRSGRSTLRVLGGGA